MIDKLPALHTRFAIFAFLILLLAAVFFLPYLVPVTPVDSLSYLVGYSNRAAFLIFVCGSLLWGVLAREYFSETGSIQQPLGLRSLFVALALTLLGCAWRIFPISHHAIGSEADYAINRIQMLASGHLPYLGFEFAYGPAHLYVPISLTRLLPISVLRAYYLWWVFQWLIGILMLWAAIRLAGVPFPHRRIAFWLLFLIQLPGIINEGTAYTPTRTIGAAFFIVLVARIWIHGHRPFLTAGTAVLCVGLAFAISPEQGVAVLAGILAWFILLTAQPLNRFSPLALITFASASAVITLAYWRLGEFTTLVHFASGLLCFPLLPSPTNIVILVCYAVAVCTAVRYLLARAFRSTAIPLFFSGVALLPAAFGRCDFGHLLGASPLLLLGVASIDSQPALRKWWAWLAILLVVFPALAIPTLTYMAQRSQPTASAPTRPDPAVLAKGPGLCPVVYRTFTIVPNPADTAAQDCLNTGYYYRTVNAITPAEMDAIVRDLASQPSQPLLLYDIPIADQLRINEANPAVLHLLELSPWVPPALNPPVCCQKLIGYIQTNYTPAPAATGGFRIWYPKPVPSL